MDEKTALVMVTLGHLSVERDRKAYLERVVELCSQATDADRCTVYVVDHEQGVLTSVVAQRLDQVITLRIGQGIAGHVAATGETVNIPDAYADPRFERGVDQRAEPRGGADDRRAFRTVNMLVVPVRGRGGEVVGVIQVLNKRGGTFERHDQMLLERIAESVRPVFEPPVVRRGGVR
jgi:signal transduction protein with GAF and PtsI domain